MNAAARPAVPSLRAPGAILLLSCYELGHAPLGLASPAGFLQAAGYQPALQDLATERLDAERVRQARFVGISVPMHTALRLGLRVAERVRALNPEAHVCCYGLYAGLNAGLLLQGAANSVVGGEYEPAMLQLVRRLAHGQPAAGPGVSTAADQVPARLQRTAFQAPARAQLRPLTDYARLELPPASPRTPGLAAAPEPAQERTVGYVEASRGCKHLCRHCPIPPVYGGRFFVVPREVLLADIAALVGQGAQHITFGDPDFLNGPGHALHLVQVLHERFPDVTYDATIKVEHLLKHQALLPELARTGCLFIVTAAESLSDAVLTALGKGHCRGDLERVLSLARAAGIALRPTWVPFTPWTTLGDYLELLEFVQREGLIHHVDPVQYAIRLLVPPGSSLLGTPQFAPFQGPLDPDALTYVWHHPDPRMDALQARVAALVEEAAGRSEDATVTFRAIYAATHEVAGNPSPALDHLTSQGHPPAPRLSEPWFC